MPRTLPWKRREQEASRRSRPTPATHSSDTEPAPCANQTSKRPRSTSPPREIFMVDGDERHRMVEDELLATARLFTAHLHAAEYERLKQAAERENAQVIRSLSRPVVGETTDSVRMRTERRRVGERQRRALRKIGGEGSGSEDGEETWQMKSLHGLMESSGGRDAGLDGLRTTAPMTRAAAGYGRRTTDGGPSKRPKVEVPSDDDDDDLDAPSTHRSAYRASQSTSQSSSAAEAKRPLLNRSHKTTDKSQVARNSKAAENKHAPDDEELDFITRLKKRQEERRQSREQRQPSRNSAKSNTGDILPDFL
ncbi:hypothetical protein GGS21DRAFT_488934 [Xylaria nigripes]|nr:hypothetical protein GGS21DRAFT_488934 [Xylaria nigripes]